VSLVLIKSLNVNNSVQFITKVAKFFVLKQSASYDIKLKNITELLHFMFKISTFSQHACLQSLAEN